MDGFQLTQAIRASKRFRSLPIVLVTALERESDKRRGLELGADAYLVKSGLEREGLLAAVAHLV
jgi:two-component system chemotaxis sensor kinase CheA